MFGGGGRVGAPSEERKGFLCVGRSRCNMELDRWWVELDAVTFSPLIDQAWVRMTC